MIKDGRRGFEEWLRMISQKGEEGVKNYQKVDNLIYVQRHRRKRGKWLKYKYFGNQKEKENLNTPKLRYRQFLEPNLQIYYD